MLAPVSVVPIIAVWEEQEKKRRRSVANFESEPKKNLAQFL